MSAAIRVTGLGKRYRLGEQRKSSRSFAELLMSGLSAPWRRWRQLRETADGEGTFWALRDIAFDVAPGEVVGIIGHNGAGKSTLLKILSRITSPTVGRIELRGKVRSLLEVGTGFHPELTGRENIYLNGAILGMSRREIAGRFDEIVAFAEIDRFLDTPVKRYSSGMYVRLAFAVAAHLQPEILIVDEVLAVGDASFQAKCLGKMDSIARTGRTVLFVSHSMPAVSRLCERAILLDGGQCVADGPVAEAVNCYLTRAHGQDADGDSVAAQRPSWALPLISEVTWDSPQKLSADRVPLGSELDVTVKFDCQGHPPLTHPVLGVVIQRLGQGTIGGVNTRMTGSPWSSGEYAAGTLKCRLPRLTLLPGSYSVDVWLGDGQLDRDMLAGVIRFQVVESDVYGSGHPPIAQMGLVFLDAEWELDAARRKQVQLC